MQPFYPDKHSKQDSADRNRKVSLRIFMIPCIRKEQNNRDDKDHGGMEANPPPRYTAGSYHTHLFKRLFGSILYLFRVIHVFDNDVKCRESDQKD